MPVRSLRTNKTIPLDGTSIRIDRKTAWGNPFVLARESERTKVISQHRRWLISRILSGGLPIQDLASLHGKDLYCWCSPLPCHGDTLAEFADAARRILDGSMPPSKAPWSPQNAGGLQVRAGIWQSETFGSSQTNLGMFAHARKEVDEIRNATSPENLREECADLLLLLMGLAERHGFTLVGPDMVEDIAAANQPISPYATPRDFADAIAAILIGIGHKSTPNDLQARFERVLSLLLKLSHHAGFSLLAATEEKLAINMTRKWGRPGPDGAIHHLKEAR